MLPGVNLFSSPGNGRHSAVQPGEQDSLTLTSQCLSTALKAMHSNQCHHFCFTNSQQRLWNRQSFPQVHQLETNPFPHKTLLSLTCSGDQIYLFNFFSLCVCGGGDVYYVISCRIQVQLAILVCVWKDPQMLSRHGKNAALEKCMFRRINNSLSLLICRSTGQREVAVLRSFVSFQSRILCLQMSLRHRAGGFCTDSTSTWMRLHRRSSAGGANLSKAGIHPGSVPSVTLFMLFRQFYLISMK